MRPASIAVLLVIGTTLTACSSAGEPAPNPTPVSRLAVTQVGRIDTLPELIKRSTAVVVAVAKRSDEKVVRGLPVTVTEVAVTRTIRGKNLSPILTVWQLGSAAAGAPEITKPMTLGSTYLLFLSAENSDGMQRTVLAGGDGLYEFQDNYFKYAGGELSKLPSALTVANSDIRISEQK
jgi:hypothetical protein